jgi:acid phosphatase (class A)
LLPAPAQAGSAEQQAELELLHHIRGHATPAELDAARASAEFDVFAFAPQIGPWFKPAALPRTAAFFATVERDTRAVTRLAKDRFQRPRPFVTDPTLEPIAIERSPSYPSGHSTRATVIALVLAELFPDHRDALLATARSSATTGSSPPCTTRPISTPAACSGWPSLRRCCTTSVFAPSSPP